MEDRQVGTDGQVRWLTTLKQMDEKERTEPGRWTSSQKTRSRCDDATNCSLKTYKRFET